MGVSCPVPVEPARGFLTGEEAGIGPLPRRRIFRSPLVVAFGLGLVLLATCGCHRPNMLPPPPLNAGLIAARFGMGTVRTFAWSEPTDTMAVGGDAGRLYLWKVSDKSLRAVVNTHSPICAISAVGPTFFVCTLSGTVTRYDTSGQPSATLHLAQGQPLCMAVDASGSQLEVGCDNGHVVAFDVATGRLVADVATGKAVRAIALAPDGRTLYSAGDDGIVHAWSLPGLSPVKASAAVGSPLLSMTCTAAGQIVCGGQDGVLRILDPATLNVVSRRTDLRGPIVSLATHGKLVAAGTSTWKLGVWSIDGDHPVTPVEGQNGAVWCCAFSADGKQIAAGGDDRVVTLHVLNARGVQEPDEVGHPEALLGMACSPDETQVATVGSGPNVLLWDVSSGVLTHLVTIPGTMGDAQTVAWTRNHLAVGYEDGSVWLLDSNFKPEAVGHHTNEVTDAKFSPDGKTLATAGWDRVIRLWKVPSGAATGQVGALQPLGVLTGHGNGVSGISFSPDGKLLVSGAWDQTVREWDLQTMKCLHTFTGIDGPVFAVAFGRRSSTVVAGGWHGQDWVWDLNSHNILFQRDDLQKDAIFSLAYSPGGRFLASGSADLSVEIFDVLSNMSPVNHIAGFRGVVRGLAWLSTGGSGKKTLDGRKLVIGTLDGNLFLQVLSQTGAEPGFPPPPENPGTLTPGASPAVAPVASPAVAPAASPAVAPVASPAVAPVASPAVAPAASPAASPAAKPAH